MALLPCPNEPHSLMSTLGRIGPPPRCGGLSPHPPRRVGLDRNGPRPPPRVGLGRSPSLRHVGLGLHSPCSSSVHWVGLHSPSSSSLCSDRCCIEVVAMVVVVVVTPRCRYRFRYALPMGFVDGH